MKFYVVEKMEIKYYHKNYWIGYWDKYTILSRKDIAYTTSYKEAVRISKEQAKSVKIKAMAKYQNKKTTTQEYKNFISKYKDCYGKLDQITVTYGKGGQYKSIFTITKVDFSSEKKQDYIWAVNFKTIKKEKTIENVNWDFSPRKSDCLEALKAEKNYFLTNNSINHYEYYKTILLDDIVEEDEKVIIPTENETIIYEVVRINLPKLLNKYKAKKQTV